jgi:hypothetical protein
MPAQNPVTASPRPIPPRLNAAERQAIKTAAAATKQAELKQEAADRRLARAQREAEQPASTVTESTRRRPRAR